MHYTIRITMVEIRHDRAAKVLLKVRSNFTSEFELLSLALALILLVVVFPFFRHVHDEIFYITITDIGLNLPMTRGVIGEPNNMKPSRTNIPIIENGFLVEANTILS